MSSRVYDDKIDLDNDEMYDYVLEREKYHDLSHGTPRCMKDFSGMKTEHFGSLDDIKEYMPDKKTMHYVYLFAIVLIILVALYLIFFKNNDVTCNVPKGNYRAFFSSNDNSNDYSNFF